MKQSGNLILALIAVGMLVVVQSATAAPTNDSGAAAVHIAKQTKEGALKRVEATALEVVATIEKVDTPNRILTLKRPNGDLVEFKVSPQVKRLAEFKAGDNVVVQMYESLAFEVRKPTPAELAQPRTVVSGAGKFDAHLPPGVEAGMVSHTIVTIEAIDLDMNTVTVKLPEGNSTTIKAKVPENLKRVKVGDTVAVTYADAVAIKIEHKKKKG